MKTRVRPGEKKDVNAAFGLIKELAVYEGALDKVSNTTELMEEDGFGRNPIFGFFVAESSENIVGLSVYYYRYSTWK